MYVRRRSSCLVSRNAGAGMPENTGGMKMWEVRVSGRTAFDRRHRVTAPAPPPLTTSRAHKTHPHTVTHPSHRHKQNTNGRPRHSKWESKHVRPRRASPEPSSGLRIVSTPARPAAFHRPKTLVRFDKLTVASLEPPRTKVARSAGARNKALRASTLLEADRVTRIIIITLIITNN